MAGLDAWLAARAGRPLALLGTPPEGLAGDPAQRPASCALTSTRSAGARTRSSSSACAPPPRSPRTAMPSSPLLQAGRDRARDPDRARARVSARRCRHGRPMTRSSRPAPTPRCCTARRAPAGSADGEFVLFDAGGEVRSYVSDVSRTYPVGGTASTPSTPSGTRSCAPRSWRRSTCAGRHRMARRPPRGRVVSPRGWPSSGCCAAIPADLVESAARSGSSSRTGSGISSGSASATRSARCAVARVAARA